MTLTKRRKTYYVSFYGEGSADGWHGLALSPKDALATAIEHCWEDLTGQGYALVSPGNEDRNYAFEFEFDMRPEISVRRVPMKKAKKLGILEDEE